jgi:hypothetical protein
MQEIYKRLGIPTSTAQKEPIRGSVAKSRQVFTNPLEVHSGHLDVKPRIRKSGPPFQSHFVAVGTPITRRPPHRSVRARSRIRLLLWMHCGKARIGIRVQNAGCGNPAV